MMRNKKFFVLLFGIAFTASIMTVGCSNGKNGAYASNPSVQEEGGKGSVADKGGRQDNLKSFSAVTLEGNTFTQEDIGAKDMTVINFWSLMCGPCVEEMPDLAAFAKALPDHVQVITVCLDGEGEEEVVKSILDEAGYEGITLLFGNGDFKNISDNIQYTPTTVIVDGEGRMIGDAIIGSQENLSEAFLMAVNGALRANGKEEIRLEE